MSHSPGGPESMDDPFDECQQLLKEVTRALQSQAFSADQQRQVIAPALRVLREMKRRATHLREEHEQAIEVEQRKHAIFRSCALLGLPADQYVSGLSEMGFREAVGHLKSRLIVLQRTELERRQRISDVMEAINAMRAELGEPPLSRTDMVRELRRLKEAEEAGTDGMERPEESDAGGADIPSPNRIKQQTATEDLSQDCVEAWEDKLKATKRLREGRGKVVRQVAQDIVQLWKDDSQVPSMSDPNLSELDRKILVFAKANYVQAHVHIGLGSAALDALVQRKHDLVVFKQDRIRTTLEISKRLRLIEDRIVLVNLMKRVEAQASNPLRLFGDSTRLQLEDRFRRVAYPRLLLIEATLRPALLVYRERHQKPFRYKGMDYLELLDEELRTRTIPRGIFGVSAADLEYKNLKPEDAEAWFGARGDDGNVYKGVSDALAKVIDKAQPDFAKVLAVSSKVSDVMAERILQKMEGERSWMEGAMSSVAEENTKTDEKKLLELGWQLPTTSPRPQVRQAAAARLADVVPPRVPASKADELHQRFYKRAVKLGAYDREVQESPSVKHANPPTGAALMRTMALVGGDGDAESGEPRPNAPVQPTKLTLPKGKASSLVPRLPPRQRNTEPPLGPVGPSGQHVARVQTASGLERHRSPERLGGEASPRVPNPAEDVTEADLFPAPPEVCIVPRPCTDKGHTGAGTCERSRQRQASRVGHSSGDPTEVFAEPEGPRLLEPEKLVPKCLPPSAVKHLKVSPRQVENIRRTRHVPLAQQKEVIELKKRRDLAYLPSEKSGYRRPPTAPQASPPSGGKKARKAA